MGKSKKASEATAVSEDVAAASTKVVVPSKKEKKARKQKVESIKKRKEVDMFVEDYLPNLKKEMLVKKKPSFDLSKYADYFKPDSGYVATFILPLFHFIGKNEIVCTRYGNYNGKECVKTNAGFNRVMWVSANQKKMGIDEDVMNYLNRRFSAQWYKIPYRDAFRAKAVASTGHEGKFKVILTNVYTDSFVNKEGETVQTLNPVLSFEPISGGGVGGEAEDSRSTPSTSSRKPREKKASSASAPPPPPNSEDEEEEDDGSVNPDAPPLIPPTTEGIVVESQQQ